VIMEEVYRARFGGDAATDRGGPSAAASSKLELDLPGPTPAGQAWQTNGSMQIKIPLPTDPVGRGISSRSSGDSYLWNIGGAGGAGGFQSA
jgi:hypothetical protein